MGSFCSSDAPPQVIEVDKRELDLLLARFQLVEVNQRKQAHNHAVACREQAVQCAKLQHTVTALTAELSLISEATCRLCLMAPSPVFPQQQQQPPAQ